MCSDSPDTSGMNAAAVASAELSKESLAWYKEEYAKTQPQRDAAAATAEKAGASQIAGMDFATQQAQDLDARNKSVFQPLENKMVADAGNYDTADRRMQASSAATADVEGAFGRAQSGLARDLARNGTAVNSGRSQSLMQDAALKKATAVAGATTGAVQNVEQQGYARTADAVALGKGIVGNQATMQQIAQTGGAQATAAAAAGVSAANSGAGLMNAGYGTALQGQGQAANIYGQVASIDQKASDGTMGAIGSMAGLATKLYLGSDKNIKSGTGKPANTKKALAEVAATPVEDGWKYDEAKGAPAGSGGPEHTGPMAQQVRKTMGEKVAPGGKVIDMVSMNGKLMAGMQELTKRMTKLERRSA
jgi:hypothetical protein